MAPGVLLAFAGACSLLFLKPGPAMASSWQWQTLRVCCSLAVLAGQAKHFLSGERLKLTDYLSGGLLVLAGLWLAWPAVGMLT